MPWRGRGSAAFPVWIAAGERDADSDAPDVTRQRRRALVATLATASAASVLYDDAGRPFGRARTIAETRVRTRIAGARCRVVARRTK
ncbi:MAG: hypothetical protein QM699_05385 [Amaricoccus sp.]|uniref:hypothetical protein n=1 Tax=Amaricoccus sp. TaxID=1872485 RepID=UPI0039E625E6